jgi:hypothetical protein
MVKDGCRISWVIMQVVYQPMSVLVMAFETDRVKQALEGFGILVPRKEQANGFQTLGRDSFPPYLCFLVCRKVCHLQDTERF